AKDEKISNPLAAAGIDPFQDIDTVLISGSAAPTSNKVLAVIRGRFDLDKVNNTAADLAKKNADKLKLSKQGGVQVFEVSGNPKPVFFAFKDRNTMVASLSKEQIVAVASGRAAGRPAKSLLSAMEKVSGKDSIWAVLLITPE